MEQPSARLQQICQECDELFHVPPSTVRLGKGKYCSRECYSSAISQKILRFCDICGDEFFVSPSISSQRYCSRGCYAKAIEGEKHPNWKGGITPLQQQIRSSPEYKEWRKNVFERDDYTCQICGKRGGKLHANHIKKFSEYPELRIELRNGVTVCIECHVKKVNWHETLWELFFLTRIEENYGD